MLFISHQNLFSFLRYLNFCSDFLVMHLDKKTMVNFKIAKLISSCGYLQTGQQIIAIHILPNNSRRKDNQAIKFGQLIIIA